jgi:hypothetical protein
VLAVVVGMLTALLAGLALIALKGGMFCVSIDVIDPPVEMKMIVRELPPLPPPPLPAPVVQFSPAPEPLRYRAEEL